MECTALHDGLIANFLDLTEAGTICSITNLFSTRMTEWKDRIQVEIVLIEKPEIEMNREKKPSNAKLTISISVCVCIGIIIGIIYNRKHA